VNPFVLDASFTMTWIIEAEQTPATMKYLEALGRGECAALVPAIWPDEVANVFLTLERAKKVTSALISGWIDTLKALPIRVEAASLEASFGEVRLLARAHRLTAYDARYLHLALRSGAPLASRDRQLLLAAREVGVSLVD
jgi:predicted nucleic acid-binding protein